MRLFGLLVLLSLCLSPAVIAADADAARDLVARLYQAHSSKQDPLQKTALLSDYFDGTLLKLYLKDQREAAGEVGRLDGDPLYNAQDMEIKNFNIANAKVDGGKALVSVSFDNLGKPTRIQYVLGEAHGRWRISDIRYAEGGSLKQILQGPR